MEKKQFACVVSTIKLIFGKDDTTKATFVFVIT